MAALDICGSILNANIAKEIVSSNSWLLHEINRHYAFYLAMTEESFAQSPFLDHRVVAAAGASRYKFSIAEILREPEWATGPACYPTRYIQHISHVGSTLLSRALGMAPNSLALREPLPLRYLASRYAELGSPESWLAEAEFMRLVEFTLRSLGRPLNGRTEVVIKNTSWTNILAPVFLDSRFGGHKQVIGVYTGLDEFVANLLRSEGGRQDLENTAQVRIKRLRAWLPEAELHLHALDGGEVAAMSWLCEMLSIQHACTQWGADLRWVDFDRFLEAPVRETASLARHLKLDWNEETSETLARSGIFDRYSKSSDAIAFSAETRATILNEHKKEYAGQIAKANVWLDGLLNRFPGLFLAAGGFR